MSGLTGQLSTEPFGEIRQAARTEVVLMIVHLLEVAAVPVMACRRRGRHTRGGSRRRGAPIRALGAGADALHRPEHIQLEEEGY